MSLYQQLINELFGKKVEGILDTENILENVQEVDPAQLGEEIISKIGEFKKNAPLFELLFLEALKKADLDAQNIQENLTQKEKQIILNMVMEFIKQFNELELTSKVDSPISDN